ncbi:ribonuclease H-like domain-containing protein [Lentinula raphanica]|uniref:Ribonuclease H-like domain-containing protein n=1 Tax=Lentinula raphanica TaxID=153919 RepID=A0AA38UED1_9AGAR|nr:ribonuclease H-like domain-containing protein [Lentinula raphanica]
MITLDNAQNNNTMMRSLQSRLKDLEIPFDSEGNRIRYVGLIACARKLVNTCRASGRRREALQDAIDSIRRATTAANEESSEQAPLMRQLVLLRDVDTRWSSIFLMIDRMLELYPAIEVLAEDEPDVKEVLLTRFDLGVLDDVRKFLKAFHLVQELASASKTPTLAMVLPLYEHLIQNLNMLKTVLPYLLHIITSALDKIHEYVRKSRVTNMYVFAMLINPMSKLLWIDKNWSSEEIRNAKEAIRSVVSIVI